MTIPRWSGPLPPRPLLLEDRVSQVKALPRGHAYHTDRVTRGDSNRFLGCGIIHGRQKACGRDSGPEILIPIGKDAAE
jgi:hypothetical protein